MSNTNTFNLQTFQSMPHGNPWATIWLAPRRTIRSILDHNPTYWVWPLSMLGGIVQLAELSMTSSVGKQFSVALMALIILLGGGVLGIVLLYVFGGLLQWTGQLLNGRATRPEIRAALAWSNLPLGVELVLMMAFFPYLWASAFTGHPPSTQMEYLSLGLIGLSRMIGGFWSLFLLVLTLAEAQRFPIWKSVANLLLAMVAVLMLGYVIFPAILAIIVMMAGYIQGV